MIPAAAMSLRGLRATPWKGIVLLLAGLLGALPPAGLVGHVHPGGHLRHEHAHVVSSARSGSAHRHDGTAAARHEVRAWAAAVAEALASGRDPADPVAFAEVGEHDHESEAGESGAHAAFHAAAHAPDPPHEEDPGRPSVAAADSSLPVLKAAATLPHLHVERALPLLVDAPRPVLFRPLADRLPIPLVVARVPDRTPWCPPARGPPVRTV